MNFKPSIIGLILASTLLGQSFAQQQTFQGSVVLKSSGLIEHSRGQSIQKPNQMEWVGSFEEGKSLARKKNKFLLVNFGGSDWCSWCMRLDSDVYRRTEFKQYAVKNLICVDLDTPRAQLKAQPPLHGKLKMKYNVTGYPTVLVFNPQGNLVGKLGYESSPDAFIKKLNTFIPVSHVSKKDTPKQVVKKKTKSNLPKTWTDFEKSLAGLDEKEARKKYVDTLRTIVADQSKPVPNKRIYENDLWSLVNALPVRPSKNEISQIANLISAVKEVVPNKDLLEDKIKSGLKHFGNKTQEQKLDTALLYFTLGSSDVAKTYLKSPDELKDEKPEVINLHLDIWLSVPANQRGLVITKGLEKMTIARILQHHKKNESIIQDLERLFALMVNNREANKSELIASVIKEDKSLASKIFNHTSSRLQKSSNSSDVKLRQNNFILYKTVLDECLKLKGFRDDKMLALLDAMTWIWIKNAQHSVKQLKVPSSNSRSRKVRKKQFIPAQGLFDSAPSELAMQGLADELKLNVDVARIRLLMMSGKSGEAIEEIVALKENGEDELAQDLAAEFFSNWNIIRRVNTNAQQQRHRQLQQMSNLQGRYVHNRGNQNMLPVSQSKRKESLVILQKTLQKFNEAGIKIDSAQALVNAFEGSHMPNQVYRREDIFKILSPSGELSEDLSYEIADTMRMYLGNAWSIKLDGEDGEADRDIHEKLKEQIRGYSLAINLVEEAAKKSPKSYRLFTLLGRLRTAEAEFFRKLAEKQQFQEAVKGIAFRKKQEAGFQALLGAANAYKPMMKDMVAQNKLPDVVQSLFGASVTALEVSSDLSKKGFAAIQMLMGAIPESKQLAAKMIFSEWVLGQMRGIPPEKKYVWLEQGLAQIGENAAANSIKSQLEKYEDLVKEVELHTSIDGSSDVTKDKYFGLVLRMRHTSVFGNMMSRYLSNGQTMYGRKPTNEKNKIRRNIEMALSDSFEIDSIAFHDQKVQAYSYGREGWKEMPVAYIVLKAKTTAVDRVPPIQMDLNFTVSQQAGQIIVPIRSPIVMLKVNETELNKAPLENLKVSQILDDRNYAAGKLSLEINVKGRGIIPPFEELFASDFSKYKKVSFKGGDLEVNDFDSKVSPIRIKSERNWIVDLEVDAANAPKAFKFPKTNHEKSEDKYEQYVGTDLQTSGEEIELGQLPASILKQAGTILLVIVIFGAVIFLMIKVARSQDSGPVDDDQYRIPEDVTPFSIIAFLKKIEGDSSLKINEQERSELKQDIVTLEQACFAINKETSKSDALRQSAEKWFKKVA